MSCRPVLIAISLLWGTAPFANAAPDEVVAEYSTGADPAGVAFGDDERIAVVADAGAGTLTVLDTADPATAPITVTTCAAPHAVALATVGGVATAVVGCDDGVVERFSLDGGTFPATVTGLTGVALSESQAILDVAIAGDDAYLLSDGGLLFRVDLPTASEQIGSGFPADVGTAAVALAAGADGASLVVATSAGTLIDLTLDDGVTQTDVVTGEADLVDVAGDGPFYALSSAGTVLSYTTGSGTASTLGSAPSGTALAAFLDDGSATLAVLGGGALTYLDAGTGTETGSAVVSSGGGAVALTDDGYAVVIDGGAALLQLLTDNPWVRIDAVSPETVTDSGESVTLTVTSDVDGSLQVHVGGGVDGSGTQVTTDVSSLTADTATDVSFAASELGSGDNLVFVFVMDVGLDIGRAATVVRSEVSSGIAEPDGFAALAGDGRVTLTWVPLEDDSVAISHYVVYFADADFDPLSGDPGYCSDADDELCSGFTVDQPDSTADAWIPMDDDTGDDDSGDDDSGDDDSGDDDTGDDDTTEDDGSISVDVSPLTNGTTYYFAVAAVTSDEIVGDFTAVVAATPQETGGAAWLSGEEGGYGCESCAVGRTFGGGALALGLLLLAVIVRRNREER